MTKRPNLAEAMRKLETPAPTPVSLARAPADEIAAPKTYYAATRAGRKKVTAALEPEAHKQLKILAADRSQTVEDLLREAIGDLFRKYGKPPIA